MIRYLRTKGIIPATTKVYAVYEYPGGGEFESLVVCWQWRECVDMDDGRKFDEVVGMILDDSESLETVDTGNGFSKYIYASEARSD